MVEHQRGLTHTVNTLKDSTMQATAIFPLTAPETPEAVDRESQLYFCSWFNSEKQRYCRLIAAEINWLTSFMTPESTQPRSMRRFLKRRIRGLSEVLMDLLTVKAVTLAEARARMASLGIVVVQPTY